MFVGAHIHILTLYVTNPQQFNHVMIDNTNNTKSESERDQD